jgi:oligosaccharyltransferase complex subunit alpha (ribophorin I)
MGLVHWLLAASAASLVQASNSLRTFENTNIQRTIELGGSLTHVTTTYAFKALGSLGPNVYTLALSELDHARTSLFDVKLKGSTEDVKVEKYGFNPKRFVVSINALPDFYW